MKYCENVEARDCNLGWAASENPTVCFLSLQYSGRTFVKAWFTDDLFFISDVSYLVENNAAWYVLFVKSI